MSELASKQCVPCRGGVPPLGADEIAKLSPQSKGWEIINQHHLQKTYRFSNFREPLDFVNSVGNLAADQGHHTDTSFGCGIAETTICTLKINGLTESGWILSAKI